MSAVHWYLRITYRITMQNNSKQPAVSTRLPLSQPEWYPSTLSNLKKCRMRKLSYKLRAHNITLLVIIACSSADSLLQREREPTASGFMTRLAKPVFQPRSGTCQNCHSNKKYLGKPAHRRMSLPDRVQTVKSFLTKSGYKLKIVHKQQIF